VTVSFEPISLHNVEDGEGGLLLLGGALVAIVVRLSQLHGEEANKWFVEVGFGSAKRLEGRCFMDINDALVDIQAALSDVSLL
jgi:hypothetical protein